MEEIKRLFKDCVKSSGAKISKCCDEITEMIDDNGNLIEGTKLSISISNSKIYDDGVILQWCKDNGYRCMVSGTARTTTYSIFIVRGC